MLGSLLKQLLAQMPVDLDPDSRRRQLTHIRQMFKSSNDRSTNSYTAIITGTFLLNLRNILTIIKKERLFERIYLVLDGIDSYSLREAMIPSLLEISQQGSEEQTHVFTSSLLALDSDFDSAIYEATILPIDKARVKKDLTRYIDVQFNSDLQYKRMSECHKKELKKRLLRHGMYTP